MLRYFEENEILHYCLSSGKIPYRDWIDSLKDKRGKTHVLLRLDRAKNGNLGKYSSVGEGVLELKIDFGPGYRIYFGRDRDRMIVLLNGGDKSTQHKDIALAKNYWRDYWRRK